MFFLSIGIWGKLFQFLHMNDTLHFILVYPLVFKSAENDLHLQITIFMHTPDYIGFKVYSTPWTDSDLNFLTIPITPQVFIKAALKHVQSIPAHHYLL